jgi:hypothetical protein
MRPPQIIGRGLLRGDTFHLRLERTGDRFAALCGTDGVHWLTCGQVILPVKDPLLVGVWAASGVVVHFDYVQVLGLALASLRSCPHPCNLTRPNQSLSFQCPGSWCRWATATIRTSSLRT